MSAAGDGRGDGGGGDADLNTTRLSLRRSVRTRIQRVQEDFIDADFLQYMAPSFGTNEPMAYAHEEEEEEAQPKEEEDQPSEQQQQQPQPPACKPPTPKPPKNNNRNNNTSSGGSKADTVSAPTNTYDELEDRPVGHDHQAEIPAWRPRPAQPTTNEAKFLPAGQLFKSEDVLAAGTGSTPQHQAADAAAAGTAAAGSAAAEGPVAPAGAIGSSFKAIYQAAPDGAARRQVLAAAIQAADNLLGPQLVKALGLDLLGAKLSSTWQPHEQLLFCLGMCDKYRLFKYIRRCWMPGCRSAHELNGYYHNVWKTRSTPEAEEYFRLREEGAGPDEMWEFTESIRTQLTAMWVEAKMGAMPKLLRDATAESEAWTAKTQKTAQDAQAAAAETEAGTEAGTAEAGAAAAAGAEVTGALQANCASSATSDSDWQQPSRSPDSSGANDSSRSSSRQRAARSRQRPPRQRKRSLPLAGTVAETSCSNLAEQHTQLHPAGQDLKPLPLPPPQQQQQQQHPDLTAVQGTVQQQQHLLRPALLCEELPAPNGTPALQQWLQLCMIQAPAAAAPAAPQQTQPPAQQAQQQQQPPAAQLETAQPQPKRARLQQETATPPAASPGLPLPTCNMPLTPAAAAAAAAGAAAGAAAAGLWGTNFPSPQPAAFCMPTMLQVPQMPPPPQLSQNPDAAAGEAWLNSLPSFQVAMVAYMQALHSSTDAAMQNYLRSMQLVLQRRDSLLAQADAQIRSVLAQSQQVMAQMAISSTQAAGKQQQAPPPQTSVSDAVAQQQQQLLKQRVLAQADAQIRSVLAQSQQVMMQLSTQATAGKQQGQAQGSVPESAAQQQQQQDMSVTDVLQRSVQDMLASRAQQNRTGQQQQPAQPGSRLPAVPPAQASPAADTAVKAPPSQPRLKAVLDLSSQPSMPDTAAMAAV